MLIADSGLSASGSYELSFEQLQRTNMISAERLAGLIAESVVQALGPYEPSFEEAKAVIVADRLAVSRALCCPPDDTHMADSGDSVSGSYEPSSEEVQAVTSACRLAMSRAPYRYRSPDDMRNN
jgi:hypothetical protein